MGKPNFEFSVCNAQIATGRKSGATSCAGPAMTAIVGTRQFSRPNQ